MTSVFRISSTLLASAIGDAWGKITEFKKFNELQHTKPAFPVPALITDDTQMAISTMQGLIEVHQNNKLIEFFNNPTDPELQNFVRKTIADTYVNWLHDSRNNRAPGETCLNALRKYENSLRLTGLEGTIPESKGCGANMRNPWFGLLNCSEESLNTLSILQAEITHSHPVALASAVLTALTVRESFNSNLIADRNLHLFDFVASKTKELIQAEELKNIPSPHYYEGLVEVEKFWATKRILAEAYMDAPAGVDVCQALNAQGWVAEEALLLAVVIADKHISNLEDTTLAAVYSNGDSDSIATIACAIVASNLNSDANMFNRMVNLEPDYMNDMLKIFNFIVNINKEVSNTNG